MFLHRIFFCLYHDHPRGHCSCLHQHTISVTIQHHSFLSYMTQAWGMPASFVHNLFLHTLWKVGFYRFPSPSNGSLLILSLSLSLTTTLSVEETLMNFSYTYAPNLIHQGASVITEISSANGYRNPASSNSYEVTHGPKLPQNHFQKVQNYTTSDKIKVRYDYTGRACTCAIQKCIKNAHAHDARLWSLKAMHTSENDAFMRLVGLPPTSGSASKLI
jgi:hypothetical protein